MQARRGSRPIQVDGHSLVWWVRRRGMRGCECCDECWVVLGHSSRVGQIVRVYIREAWRDAVTPITPGRVAALARKALARGWVPGEGTGEVVGLVDELPPDPAAGQPGSSTNG